MCFNLFLFNNLFVKIQICLPDLSLNESYVFLLPPSFNLLTAQCLNVNLFSAFDTRCHTLLSRLFLQHQKSSFHIMLNHKKNLFSYILSSLNFPILKNTKVFFTILHINNFRFYYFFL